MFNNWTDFITWEKNSQDTVDVKKIYIDIAEDVMAGIMLSQIVYWYLPSKEGKSKLSVKKKDKKTNKVHFWIAKSRDEWYEEIRFSKNNVITAMKKLEDKGIIFRQDNMFDGKRTAHIRLNLPVFLTLLNSEHSKHRKVLDEFEQYLVDEMNPGMTSGNKEMTTEPLSHIDCHDSGQPDCHEPGQPVVTNPDNPLSTLRTNITEITSKTTTENTIKDLLEEEGAPKTKKLVYKNNFSEIEIKSATKFMAPQMIDTFNELNLNEEHKNRILCYMQQAQMKFISTTEYRTKSIEIEKNGGKDKKGRRIGDPAYYIINGILKMRTDKNAEVNSYIQEKAKKDKDIARKKEEEKEPVTNTVPFYNWLEQ